MNENYWNLAIFMAADNNLREAGMTALSEIAQTFAGNPTQVKVAYNSGRTISQLHSASQVATGQGMGAVNLERLLLDMVTDPLVIATMPVAEQMNQFFRQALDGSRRNLVVFSGHSSGAVGDFLPSGMLPAMNVPELQRMLRTALNRSGWGGAPKVHKLDIIGMDSCVMSMVEVAYELRNEADYLIGSEGFVSKLGWPYQPMLERLRVTPDLAPADLAQLLVREYIHFYAPYTRAEVSVDQAVLDLRQMDGLAEAISALAAGLKQRLLDEAPLAQHARHVTNAVLVAHWRCQSYKFEQYVDLWDFCDQLKQLCDADRAPEMVAACAQVKAAIEAPPDAAAPGAVLLSAFSGPAFQHSHGVAVYFPWNERELHAALPGYQQLQFAQTTGWDQFLLTYAAATKREYRQTAPHKGGAAYLHEFPTTLEVGGEESPHKINLTIQQGERMNAFTTTRVNPPMATRVLPPMATRVLPPMATRMNAATAQRGSFTVPTVKNLPDAYLKYDDECQLGLAAPVTIG